MQQPPAHLNPRIWNETLIQLTSCDGDLDDVATLLGADVIRGPQRIKVIGYGCGGNVMLNLFDSHAAPAADLPPGIFGCLEEGKTAVEEVLPAEKAMLYIESVLVILGISQSAPGGRQGHLVEDRTDV